MSRKCYCVHCSSCTHCDAIRLRRSASATAPTWVKNVSIRKHLNWNWPKLHFDLLIHKSTFYFSLYIVSFKN